MKFLGQLLKSFWAKHKTKILAVIVTLLGAEEAREVLEPEPYNAAPIVADRTFSTIPDTVSLKRDTLETGENDPAPKAVERKFEVIIASKHSAIPGVEVWPIKITLLNIPFPSNQDIEVTAITKAKELFTDKIENGRDYEHSVVTFYRE